MNKIDLEKLKKSYKQLARMYEDLIVGNQSAWIEWKNGKGAKAGMQWIENSLSGPSLIPSDNEPYFKDPQLYFNANKSDPFPKCPCGNPSSILWMGNGYCCNEHQDMHKDKLNDNAEKETIKILESIKG